MNAPETSVGKFILVVVVVIVLLALCTGCPSTSSSWNAGIEQEIDYRQPNRDVPAKIRTGFEVKF